MKKITSLLFVEGIDDDASAVFDRDNGKLIHTYDSYHGEKFDGRLAKALGADVESRCHSDFIKEDEYEGSDYSSEPANFDLLEKRVQEYVNGDFYFEG